MTQGLPVDSSLVVIVEIKKSSTETELFISSEGIKVNSRHIPYASINKVSMFSDGKGVKLRLTLSDE